MYAENIFLLKNGNKMTLTFYICQSAKYLLALTILLKIQAVEHHYELMQYLHAGGYVVGNISERVMVPMEPVLQAFYQGQFMVYRYLHFNLDQAD